jgi:urate oxidase
LLAENSYGKSGIRLVKLIRRGDRHEVRDLTVSVQLEGDFTEAHVLGDNARVLPTDTMKNTVYAMARTHGFESIEGFALDLTAHFLRASEAASSARVTILEHPWERLPLGTGGHPHAFARAGGERRLAVVSRNRDGAVSVRAGLENLTVLKSSGSGFSGFLQDRYTTLRETNDRILATSVRAEWLYGAADVSWTLRANTAATAR